MNIEAYDLDSLRKIIRGLQEENRSLKAQLRQAGAAYNEQDYFSDRIEEYGGVNLLGSDDIWDNLIRIKSPIVAAELLELALGDDKWESWDYE